MKKEQIDLDEIKKIIQDFNLNYSQKQVANKTGFEEVYWLTWAKNDLEHIYCQYHFKTPEVKSVKEIADMIFFKPFITGIESMHKLAELRESWWKRIKFVFFK